MQTSTQQSSYHNPIPIPSDFSPQHQNQQPGDAWQMNPEPMVDNTSYRPAGKLEGQVAIVTGGDSGIGLAAAVAFAKEGADIAIVHLDDNRDAQQAKTLIEGYGRRFLNMTCDLRKEESTQRFADAVMHDFGRIDVLVNNIGVQYVQNSIEDISAQQLSDTFATNILSYFLMVKAALPHMQAGASIINTTSVTAYTGKDTLIDYSSTKGAIVSLTRSLSLSLAKRGIRVNAVAPGATWTPLIPSSFSEQDVSEFGKNLPLGRAAQPFEIAPAYVYLACDDSAFVTGQVLHVNGGMMTES